MTSYQVQPVAERTTGQAVFAQAPAQLPAVVPPRRSAIEVATGAIQWAHDAFTATSGRSEIEARHPVGRWTTRHQTLVDTIGLGGLGLCILGAGAALVCWDAKYLLALVPGAVALFTGMGLDVSRVDLKKALDSRVLDSKEMEPVVTALKETGGEERAIIRLFVEQHTAELERARRLTPAASLALRQAIKGSVTSHDAIDRVARVAEFVVRHKTAPLTDESMYALNSVLLGATPEERIAAAHYLDASLFPKELPLKHFNADKARQLYSAIAYFRGEDVPCPPTAPAATVSAEQIAQ